MINLRNFKLRDESDVRRMYDSFGDKAFNQYRNNVGMFLQEMRPNIWIDITKLMDPESYEPFVISTCLWMIYENTLSEYWDFNDDYTQIRRNVELPSLKPLFLEYEKK